MEKSISLNKFLRATKRVKCEMFKIIGETSSLIGKITKL